MRSRIAKLSSTAPAGRRTAAPFRRRASDGVRHWPPVFDRRCGWSAPRGCRSVYPVPVGLRARRTARRWWRAAARPAPRPRRHGPSAAAGPPPIAAWSRPARPAPAPPPPAGRASPPVPDRRVAAAASRPSSARRAWPRIRGARSAAGPRHGGSGRPAPGCSRLSAPACCPASATGSAAPSRCDRWDRRRCPVSHRQRPDARRRRG